VVGLLSGVNPLVSLQRTQVNKASGAPGANIGFLSRVNLLMLLQAWRLGKGFCTPGAMVRFLTGVRSNVLLQVRQLREGFGAEQTLVGFLAVVCNPMSGEICWGGEGFAAQVADETWLYFVVWLLRMGFPWLARLLVSLLDSGKKSLFNVNINKTSGTLLLVLTLRLKSV